jgi:hypothetical protein
MEWAIPVVCVRVALLLQFRNKDVFHLHVKLASIYRYGYDNTSQAARCNRQQRLKPTIQLTPTL